MTNLQLAYTEEAACLISELINKTKRAPRQRLIECYGSSSYEVQLLHLAKRDVCSEQQGNSHAYREQYAIIAKGTEAIPSNEIDEELNR